MSTRGCKPNGSGGDQPYDDRGRYAGGSGCGEGGGGPANDNQAPWWMKHMRLAPNGFPTFDQWQAGEEGLTMKEAMEAADLLERLTQAWFRAAWARDEQTMLREHGLIPPTPPPRTT